jgi:pilus assembly protein Flp/PilA
MITSIEFISNWLKARFTDTERGASLVEYALLVALIAVVCIGALQLLGNEASEGFSNVGGKIGSATAGG